MSTLRKLHKWLGLLVFIQVLLWTVSGLVISLVDAETAAGAPTRTAPAAPRPLASADILPLSSLSLPAPGLQEVRLSQVDGRPVYRLRGDHEIFLFDASSGEPVEVDAALAQRVAAASYAGEGEITGASLVENPHDLAGFEGSAWRVDFDDALGTRAWVDASDGRLLAHRNSRSGLVEFLLKLHFMDYNGGHDFNHPLIIGMGFAALWLALSGALLLISSLRRVGLR